MGKTGVYIHVPFCKRLCYYCHFVKLPFQEEGARRYVAALVEEIGMKGAPGTAIDSVYLGGGSPSLLKPAQAARVIDTLAVRFSLDRDIEITLEANPEDIGPGMLKDLKAAGINRLSLGVQSFQEPDLLYLKRNHTAAQARGAVKASLEAGFSNMNVDFIIGLPSQDLNSLEENFKEVEGYAIPHVSAYILEGVDEDESREDRDVEHYHFTRKCLADLGYEHYEVSNFAAGGARAGHNLKYWQDQDYIGAGLSASGFEEGVDYRNTPDLETYFSRIARGKLPVNESRTVDRAARRIITGLRLLEGIPVEYFKDYSTELESLLENGFLYKQGPGIAVPPEKILLLNEILAAFV